MRDSSSSENNKLSRFCVGSLIKSADTRRALNVFDAVFGGLIPLDVVQLFYDRKFRGIIEIFD
jgi:hypothetical protein